MRHSKLTDRCFNLDTASDAILTAQKSRSPMPIPYLRPYLPLLFQYVTLGLSSEAFTNVNNIANPRQPTENTPESYAWAALAVYLAQNGAKMDYSTGLARPMGEPLTSPAPGKLRRDETLVAQNFTA